MRDFELKDEYKALIVARDWKAFRAACGTHMVRGFNRKSSLSVIVQIDNISEQGKIILENTMGGSVGGSVKLGDVLGASGKVSASTTISDTLKLAGQMGRVSVRAEAVGGAGIGTVTAAISSGNLSDPKFRSEYLGCYCKLCKGLHKAKRCTRSIHIDHAPSSFSRCG